MSLCLGACAAKPACRHTYVYSARNVSISARCHHVREFNWQKQRIGNRAIVGPTNGPYTYLDSTDRPYPSLRFRPDDDIIKPIREKELGDWKKMTLEEKKLLYRYSFKRTRAELVGWNIYWKITWAYIFTALSIAFLFMALLNHYAFPKRLPTFSDDWKNYRMRNILILEKPMIEGPATKYDFENDRWKD